MTHQEAIKRVKEFGLHHAIGDLPNSTLTVKAFEMAIKALEEIQQYRSIGTVQECRQAVERQRPKKPFLAIGSGHYNYWGCPCCWDVVGQRMTILNRIHDFEKKNYCENCGTTIDWSDNDD